MTRIAVDAMGGDHAPRAIVDGAVAAARQLSIAPLLIGPESLLRRELARHRGVPAALEVVDAPDAVGMAEPPAAALRRKPRASIRVAAGLVASGDAAALFSAGSTGATVMAAHGALGMLPGAERPALAVAIPTKAGSAVLLDVGANAECRPQHLVQFAAMGTVYARVALGLAQPRVALLSIGEEESKGNELTREAHRLLKAVHPRFVGNVEAREMYVGHAEVVVCDGFTGNIVLKSGEGLVDLVETLLRGELSASFRTRLGLLLSRGAFARFRRRVEYAEHGGALLLGPAGLTVVGHGRSSPQAVRNALGLAHRFAAGGMLGRLEQELAAMTVPQ